MVIITECDNEIAKIRDTKDEREIKCAEEIKIK